MRKRNNGQQFRKILSETPITERRMEKFYPKNKDITFILLNQMLLNVLFSIFAPNSLELLSVFP